MATIEDFQKIDVRVGTIIAVEDFPQARKPAYKLTIDFGPELGIKRSSAQLATTYTSQELFGKQVLCVVNFPPRQIGPFISEVLTLGVPGPNGTTILVQPERPTALGGQLY